MTSQTKSDGLVAVPIACAVLFFAGRTLWPAVWQEHMISDVASLRAASVLKLALLLAGGLLALRSVARFGHANSSRAGWLHLGMGLLATAVGQAILGGYQFSPRGSAPFPSAADYFFFLSYPLFFAALVNFLRGYAEAGYSRGSSQQRMALCAALGGVCLVVAVLVLRPVWLKPGVEPLARFLNTAYPALDLILLVPVALLLRASLPLRGGEVWKVWAALLAGFVFMGIGDTLFAYFDALGVTSVDPLTHATYVLSYGSLALGVARQHRLLTA